MPVKLQPAFWGGLFIGVLSGLPFVGGLNMCCCLWVVAGGVLTAYLLQERHELPITLGDAVLAGLGAGAFGAVVFSVLSLVMTLVQGGPSGAFDQMPSDLPPEFAAIVERLRNVPAAVWYVAPLVVSLVIFPIFAMLGAMLGTAIFKKRLPPAPPA